ncbi:MAG: hypothetical protein LBE13_09655 [Bacteroidales bacterium]|jgi:hypothetical protein|nr:hypothetical protein [Bacteroidales bacterium]
MRTARYESELTDCVKYYLNEKGYDSQKEELQFFEYNIDIYCYNWKLNKTISIELKVHNWKRAIDQVSFYSLCSDYVYIAMPEETIHRIDRTKLEPKGIGLICVQKNGYCTELIIPQISQELRSNYKYDCIRSFL